MDKTDNVILTSNERLLRAAKALADRMPTGNLKDFHARQQVIDLREAIAAYGNETLCVADLIDCLEYKEDMAHVQVIEGKGALFWETLYAIKRGSQKANERPKCSGTMGCHVHWSGWPTHHPNCSDHPNNRSVKSEGDQRG